MYFEAGKKKLKNLIIFWLIEYGICFKPTHDSYFLFNGASTVHCTIITSRLEILGLAFIQKTSCIS